MPWRNGKRLTSRLPDCSQARTTKAQMISGPFTFALGATSSKRYTPSESYHSVIESRNSCLRSSACAARGDNLVTRCCGNVPVTS
jgi:hypothetical protein